MRDHRLTTFTLANSETITTRSALETRWAIFFSECGLKWQYEPEQPTRIHYTPDFKVDGLGFIEVKPTLELFIRESSEKLGNCARLSPKDNFLAFCGESVTFETVAIYKGKSIFAPTSRKMMSRLCELIPNCVIEHIQISMHRANKAKLDHFISVAKIVELKVPIAKHSG